MRALLLVLASRLLAACGASSNGSDAGRDAAIVDDAATTDAASTDAASTDAASTDAASTDAESTDAESTDAASTDAASADDASTDDASADAASTDAASTDAASTDAASTASEGTDAAVDAAGDGGGEDASGPEVEPWLWEWVNPHPQGNTLYCASLASPTEGWAVGARGTAVHFQSGGWTVVPTPTVDALHGVHAIDASDAWAVGDAGVILRWDGAAWARVPSGVAVQLVGVWAAGHDFAVAVGSQGTLLRWAGVRWERWDTGLALPSYLGSVSGVDATDFWVVGGQGGPAIIHFVGGAFHEVLGPTIDYWNDVSVRAADDVWIVGDDSRVAHWNGLDVTEVTTPSGGAAGTWYDSVYAGAPNDVWIASQFAVLHFDGTRWNLGASESNLTWQVAGAGATVIGAGIGGVVAERVGDRLHLDSADEVGTTLEAVWAASTDDVWVGSRASSERVLRWNGATFAPPADAALRAGGVMSIDGTAANDVWFVGYMGYAAHWDGATGAIVLSGGSGLDFNGVVALEPGHAIAVGNSGRIAELTRMAATPLESGTTSTLEAVWAAAPNDVFAVGFDGTIVRYDGSAWSPMDSGITTELHAIYGRGPGDVWAAGVNGIVLHFDGTDWSPIASAATTRFYSIADDGVRLWLVGMEPGSGAGEIWSWDGAALIENLPGTSGWLNAIVSLPGGELWTVGFASQVLRRRAP